MESESGIAQRTAPETIRTSDVVVGERIRGELGEIDGLIQSIRDNGIIQPIVLVEDSDCVRLVAGGRRLTALRRLGVPVLRHGKEFVWRDETLTSGDPAVKLKLQAIEIEENIKRKDLTWQEQLLGKRRLLLIMQSIHGLPTGRPTKAQIAAGESSAGFGVRKMAAMLGESPATVSQDLQLAELVEKIPELAKADTKGAAMRMANIGVTVLTMQKAAAVQQAAKVAAANAAASVQGANTSGTQEENSASATQPPLPIKDWELYEDFRQDAVHVPSGTADLVYTDLPFGVDLSQMSKHGASGVVSYNDKREDVVSMLTAFAAESFRVLRNDRYCVVWFGFNYYVELVVALEAAGFRVNKVPFVWFKNSRSTENPNTRYANSYDPALVCAKGSPCFIRPGQQNWANIAPVTNASRLQIAQQPVELVNRFLLDMTAEGSTVVDFCAGSGTTGEAALKLKRRPVLFERDGGARLVIKSRLGALGF